MAKYQELWESFDDSTVIGYKDTEASDGRFLSADSQEVADWIALGNTPDPAYTLAEMKAAAIAKCEQILDAKTAEPFSYGGHEYQSGPGHKHGLVMRLYAKDKSASVKALQTDGTVNTVADTEAADFLDSWGDRDDLIMDHYEVAVDDINDAENLTAIIAAVATFEAS